MNNIGDEFEKDLAKEFGIKQTPNSGAVWHSKLDLVGFEGRWSLKATSKKSISLSQDIIDEAVAACGGRSGDGLTPIWALRIGDPDYDLVVLRKNDFKKLQAGEIKFIEEKKSKGQERMEQSRIPKILRDYGE